jgi:hypothetical protein
MEEELNFIASHFYMFGASDLERLKGRGVGVLERILSSPNLVLKDEDSLVEFIASLGEECSFLYHYVEFQFLTAKGIEQFLSSFSLEDIDSFLWQSICRRLRREVPNVGLKNKRFREQGVPNIEGGAMTNVLLAVPDWKKDKDDTAKSLWLCEEPLSLDVGPF